jgi:cytochrome c553
MKLLRALAPVLLAPVVALTGPCALAADAERGEQLAWQYRCMTCHGDTGVSIDERYPHLAGQKPAYIVDRLKYFKNEVEPFNQMNGQARQLSEADMQDIAAYYAAQRR